MKYLRLSDLAEITGLSKRYWHKEAQEGRVPGAKYMESGKRRIYFFLEDDFIRFWKSKLQEVDGQCQTPSTYTSAARSGGSRKGTRRKSYVTASKQTTLDKLKSVETGS